MYFTIYLSAKHSNHDHATDHTTLNHETTQLYNYTTTQSHQYTIALPHDHMTTRQPRQLIFFLLNPRR